MIVDVSFLLICCVANISLRALSLPKIIEKKKKLECH